MNKLIKELINARKQVIEAVARVDKSKQAKAFVGEWTLKDIIAHLSGWANYQVEVIKALNNGQTPPEPGNIDGFNRRSTEIRADIHWDKVYAEFLEGSQKLVDEYKGIKDKDWKKLLWKNKKTTLEKFINIEVRHYKKTHLPQILGLMKS